MSIQLSDILAKLQRRKAEPLCCRCKTLPRLIGGSYCKGCKAIKARERYQALRAGKLDVRVGAKPKALDPRSCNCGVPRCNGLTCDSLRYGTAR